MPDEISKYTGSPRIVGFKPVGLAARQAAALTEQAAKREAAGLMPLPKLITPAEAIDRIGIVFDDSGSMSTRIENAKAGVEEFLRSCKPGQTAVAVFPMNAPPLSLSTNLPALALLIKNIQVGGCTPLLQTLGKFNLEGAIGLNIAIVFSDGSPDYGRESSDYGRLVKKHLEAKVPVDTVFIGDGDSEDAIAFMKALAEDTGGIFLHFDSAKSNFRTEFKYLSPGLRYMLADKSFVEKLEKGEI